MCLSSFKKPLLYFRRPGGEKIYNVFDNQLPAAMRKLPFEKHLSMQNVRKIVSEADGYQPHLIAPEQGYRRLIESSLVFFRGPAEAVVDAVRDLSFYLGLPGYRLGSWIFGRIQNVFCSKVLKCSVLIVQTHFNLRDLVRKSVGECTVSRKVLADFFSTICDSGCAWDLFGT